MPKPDHEPRTRCPRCGAVCTTTTPTEGGWITFHHVKEPTIGTYTEEEIVKVFAERKRFREALEKVMGWAERQDYTDSYCLSECGEIANIALQP